MIRPIKLTPKAIEECVEEFRKSITETRMYSGELSYHQTFSWTDKLPPAIIRIEIGAYMKMRTLIDNFSSEIAWQFVCHRDENESNVFHVTDVVVEPQMVTGTTVDTDQEEYEKWKAELPDEIFYNLHANCHSHVNMSVTPSGTDKAHWTNVLNSLTETEGLDVFQIFMIANKKYEYTLQVYDLTNNTYYDGKDATVEIEDFAGWGLNDFLKSAKDSVRTSTPKSSYNGYGGYNGYSGYYTNPTPPVYPAQPTKAPEKEKDTGKVSGAIANIFGKGKPNDKREEALARKAEKASRRGNVDYHGDGHGYWDDDDDYWSCR